MIELRQKDDSPLEKLRVGRLLCDFESSLPESLFLVSVDIPVEVVTVDTRPYIIMFLGNDDIILKLIYFRNFIFGPCYVEVWIQEYYSIEWIPASITDGIFIIRKERYDGLT